MAKTTADRIEMFCFAVFFLGQRNQLGPVDAAGSRGLVERVIAVQSDKTIIRQQLLPGVRNEARW